MCYTLTLHLQTLLYCTLPYDTIGYTLTFHILEYAIKAHDLIIGEIGGVKGIKDSGQLESVLEHIQNDLYYPTFADKLTHLIYSIVQFHMFLDGNKRTALLLGTYFMNINHYSYYTDIFSYSIIID